MRKVANSNTPGYSSSAAIWSSTLWVSRASSRLCLCSRYENQAARALARNRVILEVVDRDAPEVAALGLQIEAEPRPLRAEVRAARVDLARVVADEADRPSRGLRGADHAHDERNRRDHSDDPAHDSGGTRRQPLDRVQSRHRPAHQGRERGGQRDRGRRVTEKRERGVRVPVTGPIDVEQPREGDRSRDRGDRGPEHDVEAPWMDGHQDRQGDGYREHRSAALGEDGQPQAHGCRPGRSPRSHGGIGGKPRRPPWARPLPGRRRPPRRCDNRSDIAAWRRPRRVPGGCCSSRGDHGGYADQGDQETDTTTGERASKGRSRIRMASQMPRPRATA